MAFKDNTIMGSWVTTRRKFIKYLSYASGSMVLGDMGSLFKFKDEQTPILIESILKKELKGKIIKDHLLIEEYQTDFGRTIHKEPRLIIIPKDDEDVISVLQVAEKYQVPVSFRGAGHTCYGQSLSNGGILIVNDSHDSEPIINKNNTVVHSSTRWLTVEKKLNDKGVTSPVLTDFLDLTVGGTLSVGGYGLRSFQHGAQVDSVSELEVILSNGERTICSAEQNHDLFKYSLCGLGQLGYISKIKFRTIPFKKYTSVFYVLCSDIKEFISNIKKILHPDFIKEIDHFSSYWLNGTFIIEIGRSLHEKNDTELKQIKNKIGSYISFYKNTVIKDYHFYLHQVRANWVSRYGISHHIWEDYIFGLDELENFLEKAISETKISRFQNILPALYIVACDMESSNGIPFSPTFGNTNKLVYSVGFYYMVKYGNSKLLQTAIEHHQTYMKRCIELKGRPYLYGWHGLDENQKMQIYGENYKTLKYLKKQYDPSNIINPNKFIGL